MIPFRHTDERVWRAIRDLHRRGIEPSAGWAVHLDPELASCGRWFDGGFPTTLFGLPVVLDRVRCRRGEIVLVCEVPA